MMEGQRLNTMLGGVEKHGRPICWVCHPMQGVRLGLEWRRWSTLKGGGGWRCSHRGEASCQDIRTPTIQGTILFEVARCSSEVRPRLVSYCS